VFSSIRVIRSERRKNHVSHNHDDLLQDAALFDGWANDIAAEFNTYWYNSTSYEYFDNHTFGNALSLQTADALALTLNIVPVGDFDAVVARLVEDVVVTHQGHIDTGIVGARYAFLI
jgi:alpha-L-rhamnosidase